jgi:MYXO-CTERM domain-containing protein
MAFAPSLDLLSAARAFIRSSAGKAVLVIAPLAAVTLAPEAKAQAVFQMPSGASAIDGGGSSFVNVTGPSDFFAQASPQAGLVTGGIMRATVAFTLNAASGGSAVSRGIRFADNLGGTLPGGTVIPVAWDFTLGASNGSISSATWSLVFHTNTGDLELATGSGLGNFSGSSNSYVIPTNSEFGNYFVDLLVNYDSALNATLTITMAESQGIAINATAIPEPSTYATWAALGAAAFAAWRRRRRGVCAA